MTCSPLPMSNGSLIGVGEDSNMDNVRRDEDQGSTGLVLTANRHRQAVSFMMFPPHIRSAPKLQLSNHWRYAQMASISQDVVHADLTRDRDRAYDVS
jgi:hypothetical protein